MTHNDTFTCDIMIMQSHEDADKLIQDLFASTGYPSNKMFTLDMMKKIYEEDGKAYRQLIDFLGIDTKYMFNYGLAAVKASSQFKLLTGKNV